MGKQPAFQFYPGDWFREPGLKLVDLDVRGAWAELLMVMWDQRPRGQISTNIDGLSKLWRINPKRTCYIVAELQNNNIADVKFDNENHAKFVEKTSQVFLKFSQGISKVSPEMSPPLSPSCPQNVPSMSPYKYVEVTIINRRMLRDWKNKEKERVKKQKQREKKKNLDDVPSMFPSYSSSSIYIPPLTPPKGGPPLKGGDDQISEKRDFKKDTQEVLDYLNKKFHRKFTDGSQIIARLKQGGTVEQCKQIIDTKSHDPHFQNNPHLFCPTTLFRKSHWDAYLNQKPSDFTRDGPEPVIVPYKPPKLPEEHDRVSPEEIRETRRMLRKGGLRQ